MKQAITVCLHSHTDNQSALSSCASIGGKCETLISYDSGNVLLHTVAFTIEDEIVGTTVVGQGEHQRSALIAGWFDATPATIDLTIAPGIEMRVAVAGIVLDGHRVGRLLPAICHIEEVATHSLHLRSVDLRTAVVVQNEVERAASGQLKQAPAVGCRCLGCSSWPFAASFAVAPHIESSLKKSQMLTELTVLFC